MAKKQFAQQRLGWQRDARCLSLKYPAYKWINSVLWNMAVEYRCETLPSYINATHIAHESACDLRTVRKCLTFMSTLMPPLVTENEDKTITVHGARNIHESSKYPWKDGLHDINVSKDVDKNVSKDVDKNVSKSSGNKDKDKDKDKDKIKKKKAIGFSSEILEIAQYYESNLHNEKIEQGKKNLKALLKKTTLDIKTLFSCVKNYFEKVNSEDVEYKYIIRMSNFFGRDARYREFIKPIKAFNANSGRKRPEKEWDDGDIFDEEQWVWIKK